MTQTPTIVVKKLILAKSKKGQENSRPQFVPDSLQLTPSLSKGSGQARRAPRRASQPASGSIDIAPMPDGDYKIHKNIIIDIVNDPIVADADTPSLSAGELPDSGRSWIIGMRENSLDNVVPVGLRNAR